jgi:hypothetical protein
MDLKFTLPRNMSGNPDAEFILLDYGSSDDMAHWVWENHRHELETGQLRFFQTVDTRIIEDEYDYSHTKNITHRLATGDVLCNIDADNFTGHGFTDRIKQALDEYGVRDRFVLVPKGRLDGQKCWNGLAGRIAVHRDDFHRMRGYDESFDGYGWEDSEFLWRAREDGFTIVEISERRFLRDIFTPLPKKTRDIKSFGRRRALSGRHDFNIDVAILRSDRLALITR